MRPVSSAFLDEIATSHDPAISVTVDGTELPISSGSVTLDRQAATRGAITLDIAVADGTDWIPDSADDLLAPYGNEIVASRGVRYADGSTEMVPLGIFRIDEADASDSGEISLTVSGLDRSAVVIDAVFERGRTIAAGSDAAGTIQALIDEIPNFDPAYAPDFLDTAVSLPSLSYEAGDDRWDFCLGLAEAVNGSSLYFDGSGVLTLRRSQPTATAAYSITEGANLISASKRWGREDACNRVVVTGETSSDDPVVGIAVDNEPGSPTNYYYSKFGQVTFTYSSEYVIDADQAASVAQRILTRKLGTGQQIGFDSLVNPALEPGDTIEVVRERIGVSEYHVIDSLTIPLTKGEAMSCTTRVARING